jgi:hypothetical protein
VRTRHAAVAIVAGLLLVGCSHSKSSSGTSVFNMKLGNCLVPPTDIKAEITSVKVVPCTVAHTQEVFAFVNYGATAKSGATTSTSDAFPGTAALRTFADGACLQQFANYVGVDYRDSSLFYTYMLPSARSWSSHNDRGIVCLVTTTGQHLTASVKGSRL